MITRKRQVFIDEYIRTMNGTQSAITAGFSPKMAYSYASELLRKPEVKQAVDEGIKAKCEECKLTKESLTSKLSEIIFSNESKPCDVTRAIEVASRLLGLLKHDQSQHIALFQQIQHESGKEEEKEPYIPKRNGYIEGEDNTQGQESNIEGIIQGK